MAENSQKFQPGDVVALKSSPYLFMTVQSYKADKVICVRFNRDGNNFKYEELPEIVLEKPNQDTINFYGKFDVTNG